MKRRLQICTLLFLLQPFVTYSQQQAFGSDQDLRFGNSLWYVLNQREFAGEDAILARPYEGTDPHGNILVTLDGEVEIDGELGAVIVKRNYGGEGATVDSVLNDPQAYLLSTTVMYRRPDPEQGAGAWFWAKYLPDGSFDTAPNGTPMAGKVPGCITCHEKAPGGDKVYLHDRYR